MKLWLQQIFPPQSSAESPRTSKTPAYFTTKIPLTAKAIARYGVSDEAAAFILSSYNKDRDIEDVVTRKKIRCQRESGRSDHVKKLSGTSAGGIYFDGRDDYTLQNTALGSTSLIKEGHYTINAYPGEWRCIPWVRGAKVGNRGEHRYSRDRLPGVCWSVHC